MVTTLKETNFSANVKRGKVRDAYEGKGGSIIFVVTDRISAYDVVLNQQIPYKGQGLNASSAYSFEHTSDIIPNAYLGLPHPNVMAMERCEPIPVEVVIRGTLSGSAWRAYKNGKRTFFDTTLPEGLRENQDLIEVLGKPLHTPTTKANVGHDTDVTPDEAEQLAGGPKKWRILRDASTELFLRANEFAGRNDYREADTKYEFGMSSNGIVLFDEANTHDSSRFFRKSTYRAKFESGQDLDWIDKEYVRKHLREVAKFLGDGPVPDLPPEVVQGASDRVIESVRAITGKTLEPYDIDVDEIRSIVSRLMK